jgi:hypothetical protein
MLSQLTGKVPDQSFLIPTNISRRSNSATAYLASTGIYVNCSSSCLSLCSGFSLIMGRKGKNKLPQLTGALPTSCPPLKYSKSITICSAKKTGHLGAVTHDTQHKRPRSPSPIPEGGYSNGALAPEANWVDLDASAQSRSKKPCIKIKKGVNTIGVIASVVI